MYIIICLSKYLNTYNIYNTEGTIWNGIISNYLFLGDVSIFWHNIHDVLPFSLGLYLVFFLLFIKNHKNYVYNSQQQYNFFIFLNGYLYT